MMKLKVFKAQRGTKSRLLKVLFMILATVCSGNISEQKLRSLTAETFENDIIK